MDRGDRGDRCDLLIVAAFAPELAALRDLTGEAAGNEVGGLRIVAKPVGIGLVAAATGTTSRVETYRPRAVVLVGTCGAYPSSGLQINDVVVVRKVSLVEPSVEQGLAAFPEPMSVEIETHAAMRAALSAGGAPSGDVANTLGVTTDDGLAGQLARSSGADVEHLEAYAVGAACAAVNVPFAAVLGVANDVGSRGREQWRAGHVLAGRAVARLVSHWLHAGAAGVPHRP